MGDDPLRVADHGDGIAEHTGTGTVTVDQQRPAGLDTEVHQQCVARVERTADMLGCVEILVDRESVCAADDAEDHRIRVRLPDGATLVQALTTVNHRGFPGFGSWLVRAGRAGVPLAAIRIRYVAYVADRNALVSELTGGADSLALYYADQSDRDPDAVCGEYLDQTRAQLTGEVLPQPDVADRS